MATVTAGALEEYLATDYGPDVDFIDGVVKERGMAAPSHGLVETATVSWFRARRRELGIWAMVEVRLKISSARFRVPDVMVGRNPIPVGRAVETTPLLCVEVPSPDDTLASLRDRIDDYARIGVPNIWAFDPTIRRAWKVSFGEFAPWRSTHLEIPELRVAFPVAEAWSDLAELG
jgi:Uma2 family endonuclease